MNKLVYELTELLSDANFEYAICGGQAIDMFVGRETRVHGDIDIAVFWDERSKVIEYMWNRGYAVYEMLGGGKAHKITDIHNQRMTKRNIFCINSDCQILKLYETDEADVSWVDFSHEGLKDLSFIEFLFNTKTESRFIYARNESITRDIDRAIVKYESIPCFSPEICLLYKSTDTEREGYQQDYEIAIGKMTDEQKEWLNDALKVMFPNGHKWIT